MRCVCRTHALLCVGEVPRCRAPPKCKACGSNDCTDTDLCPITEEDAYSRFLSEHGGSTNAYTAAEATNYHFDCNSDSLAEALDRFSQFFISPLISEDGVEREVNAVDSECASHCA